MKYLSQSSVMKTGRRLKPRHILSVEYFASKILHAPLMQKAYIVLPEAFSLELISALRDSSSY